MKRDHPILNFCAMGTLAFLYVPLFAVAAFSLNASRYGLVWKGATLDWYVKLLHNNLILHAAWNTLVLAVGSTLIATVLGTALAIGMDRHPWPRRVAAATDFFLYLPVVTPDIILAATLVISFGFLRTLSSVFELGMPTMILGHVTFQIAFVAMVVRSRLALIGRQLDEAARDLYAGSFYILRRVTLPLLLPGIVAGAMLALTLSLDDFVISFFTAGPDSMTLPLFIYAAVHRGVTPEIHALSTVILLVTVLLVVVSERITRPTEQKKKE